MRILCLVLLLALVGCDRQVEVPESGGAAVTATPVIYTVNYPLAWLAQQLVADAARVEFPAPAGEDPAFWKPSRDIIAHYQQADLVLLNGAGYARWLGQVSLPENSLIDTSAGYVDRLIHEKKKAVHSHGPEGEHSHTEVAFTTWLDLELLAAQAEAVAAALNSLLPGAAAEVDARLAGVRENLAAMDDSLRGAAALIGDNPVLYSHPVYQYLQRRYGFNGRALHWEPGQVPGEEEWGRLEGLLAEHPAQWMLWEGRPLPEVAERLSGLGVTALVFQPMGNRPSSGDFEAGMRGNIARLRAAFEAAGY
jgi:zinc transport system substrate-binding protein